jgi:hypothetical protein
VPNYTLQKVVDEITEPERRRRPLPSRSVNTNNIWADWFPH